MKYVIRTANGRAKDPRPTCDAGSYRGRIGALKYYSHLSRPLDRFMTYTAQPTWGSTVDSDIAFDGLATHDTTNNSNQSGRNGGNRRGAR
jgi:hypothetical protein